jgi:hypothetical protein
MGEPSPYQYTYKDIERYHSGQMSEDEMHRMEMAALDDPFLADALEGYSYTSTAKEDLNKLQDRLFERTNQKEKVFWIGKNYNWLKIAAVLLFVIAGSWLLVINRKQSSNDLALERKPDTTTKGNAVNNNGYASAPANTQADSALKNESPPSTNDVALTYKPNLKKHFEKQKADKEVATVAHVGNTQPVLKDTSLSDVSIAQVAPSAKMETSRAFKAESKSSKDSSADLFTVTRGAKKNSTDTVRNLNVVLKPQAVPALNEVVVTQAKSKQKRSRSPFVIVDTLEPENGWAEYNDYIVNNLKSPDETKVKTLSGEVQLSFDVNESGTPVNIKVEKSLCDPCDTEAIRLLKEGPKWKKKKNKKGKITIHF